MKFKLIAGKLKYQIKITHNIHNMCIINMKISMKYTANKTNFYYKTQENDILLQFSVKLIH